MAVLTAATGQSHCMAGTLLVYNTNDSGAGSLRQAIVDNNVLGGGNTIVFSNSFYLNYDSISLTSGELLISKNVTILGPSPDLLDVGSYPNTNRVFHIGPNITVTISGLSVFDGYLLSTAVFPDNCGAGIFNDHSTLTVSNCYIDGNYIQYPAGGSAEGGGIYNYEGTLTVIDSAIYDNFSRTTAAESTTMVAMEAAARR